MDGMVCYNFSLPGRAYQVYWDNIILHGDFIAMTGFKNYRDSRG